MSSEKKPQPVAKATPIQRYNIVHGMELEESDEGFVVEYVDHETTIEALRAERDDVQNRLTDVAIKSTEHIEHWRSRAKETEARVAQLEAALEPFAKAASHAQIPDVHDSHNIRGMGPDLTIRHGDLRRARALLSDGGRS